MYKPKIARLTPLQCCPENNSLFTKETNRNKEIQPSESLDLLMVQLVHVFYNTRITWDFSTKLKCSVKNVDLLARKKSQKENSKDI